MYHFANVTRRTPEARPVDRRGVSLLEIMISIGVIGIGLIGVASLVPLAQFKAEQGVQDDRKAMFGRRAYREFFAQGFNEPGSMAQGALPVVAPSWLQMPPANPTDIYNYLLDPESGATATGPVKIQTYCFDPLWVAARHELGSRLTPGRESSLFPDLVPTVANPIQIPRVTVRQQNLTRLLDWKFRQIYAAQPTKDSAAADNASFAQTRLIFAHAPIPMSLTLASEVFQMKDDLETLETADPAQSAFVLPPRLPGMSPFLQRQYLRDNGLGNKNVAAGKYSWMATLVPEIASWNMFGTPPFPMDLANRFRLSVVVFHRRDLSGLYQEECLAEVVDPLRNAILAGPAKQITIQETATVKADPLHVGVRHIRGGDWVALVQNPMPPQPFQPNFVRLQWYQVSSVDELDEEFDRVRDITLTGPDWSTPLTTPVYLIYLRNVAAVYEKVIELQR